MVCDWTAVKDSIHLPLSYFIEDLDIVKLDNKDEALVRNSSVTVSDNYILIHCSQNIPFKLFDRKGKFLRNNRLSGKRSRRIHSGRGPFPTG